jgi:hypothetical protein
MNAEPGSYSASGSVAELEINQNTGPGAYTITGAATTHHISMYAAPGAYAYTGFEASVAQPFYAGSYTLSGASIGIDLDVGGDVGSYGVTGVSATTSIRLATDVLLVADPGSYSASGAADVHAIGFYAFSTVYNVSGRSAQLVDPTVASIFEDIDAMPSKTEIFNMALGHLAVGEEVSNADTDPSEGARACRVYWARTVDACLRDGRWPFARRIKALALVGSDPTEEWDYSYRYPTDCLFAHRILSGDRNAPVDSRVKFEITADSNYLLIYADEENAELEYTYREPNELLFPADFAIMLSYRLAAYIAPRLMGGDPAKLGERALQLYFAHLYQAQANAHNEDEPDNEPESEFQRSR